jgi:N-dimethylarginine dimethylaminohydrolase
MWPSRARQPISIRGSDPPTISALWVQCCIRTVAGGVIGYRLLMSTRTFGAQSMIAPLREALVKRPGEAFGHAFADPAHGFLHPVDLPRAQREHDGLRALLERLGVIVHELGVETRSPDLVYTFDPALVTDRGAVLLRSGKANRRGEEEALSAFFAPRGIPILGRIEAPGTVDGGDTFWIRPDMLCIGRSLRTNRAGAEQLAAIVGGDARIFDVPHANGPGECLHLLSLISPVADDLAVVFLPQLPSGLFELLGDLGVRLVPVPAEEIPTLGCNVLAVRPRVVIMAAGNPRTEAALRENGCEVHTFEAGEVGVNGGGGPTCLTRPLLRG